MGDLRGTPHISLPSHPTGPYAAWPSPAACSTASSQLEAMAEEAASLHSAASPRFAAAGGVYPPRCWSPGTVQCRHGDPSTPLPSPALCLGPARAAAGWRCPSRGTPGAVAMFPGGTRSGRGASPAGTLSAAHRVPERARWRAAAR